MKNYIYILLLISLVIAGCGKSKEQKAKEAALSKQPQQQVMKFALSGYGKDKKKNWELEGKSADIEDNDVKLRDVKARTYGKDTNFVLTADKGLFNRAENKATLEQNVNAVIDDQKRVSKTVITCTGPLQIDYKNNFATFNENVHVKDQQGTITSDKATVHFDTVTKKLKKIILTSNVHIMQGLNESFCDEAAYDAIESKITLNGSPKILISSQDGKFSGIGGVDMMSGGSEGKKK